jgi:thioredoxin reductase
MFDTIIVGGGPAGLSAALMLGRCRRRIVVCDLGEPRNRRSRAVHGYLTRDGAAPRALTDLGREELARYGVEFRCIGVVAARCAENRFIVSLADGTDLLGRFLLIATGVVDDLPGIPGMDDCYGRSVFHCPYCDGWEHRDQRLAAFGTRAAVAGLALGLLTWSQDVVVCTHGGTLDRRTRARLARNGVTVRDGAIARLDHQDGLLRSIEFVDGSSIERDALFFTTDQHPQSPIATGLGCALTRKGTVQTGLGSQTNVPRVFVAGDASHDAQFVVVAAAEGVKAAVAINRALQQEEWRA